MFYNFLPSANVKAQRSTWFIGDLFLKETFHAYAALKEQAMITQTDPPYMYCNYSIDAFKPTNITAMSSSPLARILNGLVDAINTHHILPRLIVFVPDWDLLKAIKYYDFGVSRIIGTCVEWLIREIDRITTTRKLDLSRKRAGSVVPSEPKIVWIAMIVRSAPSRILALRRKFNAILEETLSESRGMYFANIQKYVQHMHFDRNNFLNPQGLSAYWRAVDRILEDFDKHKKKLIPKPVLSDFAKQDKSHKGNRFALPRPPPEV